MQGAQEMPIAMGLNKFLDAPKAASVDEMGALRDGLIQILGMLTTEIQQASSQQQDVPPAKAPQLRGDSDKASLAAAERITGGGLSGQNDDFDAELKAGLGLLLKHRGGPGFGHGRLQGVELDSLEDRLRSITKKLKEEAMA